MIHKISKSALIILLIANTLDALELARKNHFIREDEMLKLVDERLQEGGSINMPNEDGDTPLLYAADFNYIRLSERCLNEGADIIIKNKAGKTALDYAARAGNDEMAEYFTKLMLNHAQCSPYFTKQQLQASARRIRYTIWLAKQIVPRAPKEVIMKIVQFSTRLWQDMLNTPLHWHAQRYDLVPHMPLPTIRILLAHDGLDLLRTVAILRQEKYKVIEKLMDEVTERAKNGELRTNEKTRDLLNSEKMEEHFGNSFTNQILKTLKSDWDPAKVEDDPFRDLQIVQCRMQ